MKRNSKMTVLFALVLCLAMALTGCAAKTEIGAKVGDREVTVAQIENYYLSTASSAYYYGYDVTTEEGIKQYVDYIVDSLITSALLGYKAEQAGITLTAEEEEEAKAAAEAAYEAFYQEYVSYAEQARAQDKEAYANELLTDMLVQNGMTIKKVKQSYLDAEIDSIRVQKHQDQLLEGVAPTAEQIKTMFDEEQASQQALVEADPAAYFTQETYYMYGYSYMPLVIPEGLFYVRHILIEDEETAKDVMEQINNGADFEEMLAQYNTDPGMTAEENAQGYLVGEGASFVEGFLNGALSLSEEGAMCLAESDYGFHIIKRMADAEARVIPYEEVQETFDLLATANFTSEYYADIVDGWKADESIVTRYEEAYASVGK